MRLNAPECGVLLSERRALPHEYGLVCPFIQVLQISTDLYLMASVQKRGNKWQVRILKRDLLPKDVYKTFDDEASAKRYARMVEGLLDRGHVPPELAACDSKSADPTLKQLLTDYLSQARVAPSDRPMVIQLSRELHLVRYSNVTASWADHWIYKMKVEENFSPGTIRKHVGSLARALDWHIRRQSDRVHQIPVNPLRLLPRSYSQYTKNEADQLVLAGKKPKIDESRDRRLSADEESNVRAALAGVKRPDRERPLLVDDAFRLFFDLILNTGLRLSEAYRLRVDHYDAAQHILHLDSSKVEGHITKRRSVPVPPCLRARLRDWCDGKTGLMFPFWDGEEDSKPRTSGNLSNRFATLFKYAGVDDFREHDLRHEATCRWVSMKSKDGGWLWSEAEVCKIMGWSSSNMYLRYASLRASDLAKRMDW